MIIINIKNKILQRLEMRAKKFGVPLSGDAKKEVRAQRFGQTPISVTSTKATITFGKISSIPETVSYLV